MSAFSRRSFGRLGSIAAAFVVTRSAAVANDVLALKGYDPVAYFTLGKPMPGSPDIEHVWDERRFRFASVEHRDMFRADPVRFAPQFQSYCTMSLTRGVLVEGNPEHWVISDGRLYIFAGPSGPALFQQSPNENTTKADKHRNLIR